MKKSAWVWAFESSIMGFPLEPWNNHALDLMRKHRLASNRKGFCGGVGGMGCWVIAI